VTVERPMGERRLAAIMFTDIVGYAALMAESECGQFFSQRRIQ
jgi:class 3 adenylate cyclase